jgi:CubicO group peptidase (beta-lactamase class C family)
MIDLRSWLEQELERFDVPGVAVAVVHEGKTQMCDAVGLRDREADLDVTPDTAFAIGSVTKSFTAAGIGALVDDGVLAWDEPVRRHLRDFELRDHVATERMTVVDMLSHRSGLPRHDLLWYGNNAIDRADAVHRLRHLEPNRDFRTAWQYNNLLYLTAGHLCEVVTGESWEDLLRRRLFEPLGMTSTTFSYEEAEGAGEVALPYAERRGEVVRIPYAQGSWLCGPAGSVYSTLTDMVRWLELHMGGGADVLTPGTLAMLHKAHMVMPQTVMFPEARDTAYGLGWFMGTYRGHKLVHHGGNIDGFTSLVSMLPDEGVGVVFLSNRDVTMLRAAFSYHVFDELLGLDPLPWPERVKEFWDATTGGAKAAKARVVRADDRPPVHPLDAYAGDYEHPGYGTITISVDGDRLVPRLHDLALSMAHRHYETYDLEVGRFEEMQMTVTFRTDAEGDVADLAVPFEPSVEPIVFTRLPDPELSDEAVLRTFEGTYAMGPLTLEVTQSRPGRLTAAVAGQGPMRLVPHRGRRFRVDGVQGASATFEVDDDGAVREVLVQPVGVFTPAPSEER